MLDPNRNPYAVSWLYRELTLLGQQLMGNYTGLLLLAEGAHGRLVALIMALASFRAL